MIIKQMNKPSDSKFLIIPWHLTTWLKEKFILADKGGKGRLNEKEVLSVVGQLNEQIPESVIRQRFKVGENWTTF